MAVTYKVWTTTELGVFGVLEERSLPLAKEVEFSSPGVANRGVSSYTGSGSLAPRPADRWSRTIDLGPGEYWNMSNPRTVPNYYKMYNDLKRFNDVGTALGTVGFGFTEWALSNLSGAFSSYPGSGRTLNIPGGWTGTNAGCEVPGRFWGENQIVACGTSQVRTFSLENKILTLPGPLLEFIVTPTLPINPTAFNTFHTVGRYTAPVGTRSPYRYAAVSPGVMPVPWVPMWPTTTGLMSHPIRPRGRQVLPYQINVQIVDIPVSPPNGPVKVGGGVASEVPPPDGVPRKRKFKAGKGGVVGDAYGALTELTDLMDCMKQSIKNKSQRVGKSHAFVKHQRYAGNNPYDEFRYIVNNAERMDPLAFVKCFGKKELGDQLIGRANRAASAAAVKSGYWPFARGVGISRLASHGLSNIGSLRMR